MSTRCLIVQQGRVSTPSSVSVSVLRVGGVSIEVGGANQIILICTDQKFQYLLPVTKVFTEQLITEEQIKHEPSPVHIVTRFTHIIFI